MTLSRWRRIATGIAAGVIVLCAALLGASFRSDNAGVSVAAEVRPDVVIEIPDDDAEVDEVEGVETTPEDDADQATSDETDVATDDSDASASDTADGADADDTATGADATDDASSSTDDDGDDDALTESVTVIESDDADADDSDDATSSDDDSETAAPVEDTPAAPAPVAPVTPGLGTGGGVDDAECALDRLVIYAGARVGGVAGSIRAALAQAGFAAGCPNPVTVLASNCPQQFSGVLGSGSGYDPNQSFVASSASVDRETMTAVMGTVGFTGSQIDILDFGFVNADQPGEQWMAIFIPPDFAGWETLASRAGLAATATSICGPTGHVGY